MKPRPAPRPAPEQSLLRALCETFGFAEGAQLHPLGSNRLAVQSKRDLR